ncbi:dihydrofolate reductase family protein [Streptomyces fagopyri]|uniref:dihydrofolate reductase family protein n=1 Tax=Streptomyces fagopyri TaxID=2662397 RepID=UPI001D1709E7|nr:dihydrofolate reductase family protein [Streptomyces fagopyri]
MPALVLDRHRRHRHEIVVDQKRHQRVDVRALVEPKWRNSTMLKGEVVREFWRLKQERDGEMVVYGSYQLGRLLMEHGLVDELRLMVFPVALGTGERFLGETGDKKPRRLINSRTVGDGLALLTYEMVREA